MKIGIIGLGLIGGSIAKALKKHYKDVIIIGNDKSEIMLKEAMKDKIIDGYSMEIDKSFFDCEIIFIGVPVSYTVEVVKKISAIVNKNCIVTDVGSTKFYLCNEIRDIPNVNFIGGHPMAGSEKNSYLASTEILFENAFYIITPYEESNKSDIKKLTDIIVKIGGIPVQLNCDQHDYVVSVVSHLPQLVASTLVNFVEDNEVGDNILHTLCAGGFKDTTRIASSDGELWESIISNNKDNVINNMNKFIEELIKVRNSVNNIKERPNEIIEYINKGKIYRNSFESRKSNGLVNYYKIAVDVPDEPMVIAKISTLLGEKNINIKNIGINNNREEGDGILEIIFADEDGYQNAIKILTDKNYSINIMK